MDDTTYDKKDDIDEQKASIRFGIPRGTLQQWRYKKRGPPWHKVGRTVRYHASEFRAWLAAGKRHPADAFFFEQILHDIAASELNFQSHVSEDPPEALERLAKLYKRGFIKGYCESLEAVLCTVYQVEEVQVPTDE